MSNTSNITAIPANLIQTGTINAAKINPGNIITLAIEPREFTNQVVSYIDYMTPYTACKDCIVVGGQLSYVFSCDGDTDIYGNMYVRQLS